MKLSHWMSRCVQVQNTASTHFLLNNDNRESIYLRKFGAFMYDLVKLIHLIASILWMGGMAFMLMALRPAALAIMDPQPRARLMVEVWQRFFLIVIVAIVALFTTGTNLYTTAFRAAKAANGSGSLPLGWSLMLVIGIAMMLIFGHIYFAGFRKFKRAVAAAEFPVAAEAAAQVQMLVVTNFVLGWVAIAAVRLVR